MRRSYAGGLLSWSLKWGCGILRGIIKQVKEHSKGYLDGLQGVVEGVQGRVGAMGRLPEEGYSHFVGIVEFSLLGVIEEHCFPVSKSLFRSESPRSSCCDPCGIIFDQVEDDHKTETKILEIHLPLDFPEIKKCSCKDFHIRIFSKDSDDERSFPSFCDLLEG